MPITNDKMRAELRATFERYDADGNGIIDLREFERLVRALGQASDESGLARQFAAIDTDGSGGIGFEEFVAWWIAS